MEKLKVFISGTQNDMLPERDAADQAVRSTFLARGIRAETAASQPQSPRTWIEEQLRDCNIYLGIYSHRYGWVIPEENISATEYEFNLASKLGIPILVWIRKLREDEKTKPDFDKQEKFLSRVSDFSNGYLRQEFDDPIEITSLVTEALQETFIEIIRKSTTNSGANGILLPSSNGKNIIPLVEKISTITTRSLRKIQILIPGMDAPILRDETTAIEELLSHGQPVVLTGDAGTGKSGIAAQIAQNGVIAGIPTLLFDAREIGNIQAEKEINEYFDFPDPFTASILQLCNIMKCRLIIDQLDNIAGFRSARIIVAIIQELAQKLGGLELLAICRNKEQHEHDLIDGLLAGGLTEIICNEISQEQVIKVLAQLGITNYSTEILDLGKNLLNMELVGQIHIQQPEFDFTSLTDEVYLWEKYIDIWCSREGRDMGEEMLKFAAMLARSGLNHPDGMVERAMPSPIPLQRLVSWKIITHVDGRMFRFRHEKFQDYVYARDAADRLLMPRDILNEIPEHKSRNVFRWVDAIYTTRKSPKHIRFIEEVFNG